MLKRWMRSFILQQQPIIVDNSFGNSIEFTLNNVLGTHKLLEACRIYGNKRDLFI